MGPIRSCKDSISYAMLCLWPISIYKSPSQNASAPMAGKRRTLLDIAAAACTPPEAACAPETSHNKSSAHRIPPDPTFRSLDEKPTPLSFHSWRLVEDVCSHWQSLELATVVTHFWAGHVRSAARSLPTSWFQLETPHLLHWFMMPWRCWIYCNRDRERGRHIDIGACLSVYQSIYWSVNLTILTYLISSS